MLAALVPLLIQYGPGLVAELIDLFNKPTVTGADFLAICQKYGVTSSSQYLQNAGGAPVTPTT